MADFNEVQIQKVWEKGVVDKNNDQNVFRKDVADAWIKRDQYGKKDEPFGWEIDHVYPQSKGGNENIINLRPMHWENNQSKGDDYPDYRAVKTSEGDKNINKSATMTVNKDLQSELQKIYRIK